MKAEPLSLFDRVAIGFGATIIGGVAALILAFATVEVVFFLDEEALISERQVWRFNTLLFWTVPIRFALLSGVMGFLSPKLATICIGKVLDVGRLLLRIL